MPNMDASLMAFGKQQLMVWGLRGSKRKNHIRVGEAEVWQAFWLLFKTNRMFRIKDTFYFKELGNVRPLLSNKSPRKEGRVQEGIFSLHFLIKVSNFQKEETCRYLVQRGEGGKGEGRGKKREKMEEGKEREKLSLSIIINCQLLTQNIAPPSPFHWSVSPELSLTESEIKMQTQSFQRPWPVQSQTLQEWLSQESGYAQLLLRCSCTKESHNSPEWSVTKAYLFEDKLTTRVVTPQSSACTRNWNRIQQTKWPCTLFLSPYGT